MWLPKRPGSSAGIDIAGHIELALSSHASHAAIGDGDHLHVIGAANLEQIEEIMKTDPDCIFCKIVAGQMPCFKLSEDVDTFAFGWDGRSARRLRFSTANRSSR